MCCRYAITLFCSRSVCTGRAVLVAPVRTALFARGSHRNRVAPPLTSLCSHDLSNFLFTLPLSSLFIYFLLSAPSPQTRSLCWLQFCVLLPTANCHICCTIFAASLPPPFLPLRLVEFSYDKEGDISIRQRSAPSTQQAVAPTILQQ